MDRIPALQLSLPASCSVFRHEAMATHWEFWLAGHEASYLEQAAQAAFERVDEVERSLSLYLEASDVSRVNRAVEGETIRVGEELRDCLLQARDLSSLCPDAFNVFLGAASLDAKKQRLPHLPLPAPRDGMPSQACIRLDPETSLVSKLPGGALLDLGAMGKGYALDQAALVLQEWQVSQACLISGGSSVLALHAPAGSLSYTLHCPGLDAPILLSQRALGASGLGYQGEHIIDPLSGRPRSLYSRAYAFAGSAAAADALSTAAMLLNETRLREIAAKRKDIEFILVPKASPSRPGESAKPVAKVRPLHVISQVA